MHKDTIAVALAASGLRGEVREYGKIPNTPAALKALAVKLAPAGRDLRQKLEAQASCGNHRGVAACMTRAMFNPRQVGQWLRC